MGSKYFLSSFVLGTESNDTNTIRWRRDCGPKDGNSMGCTEHKYHGSDIIVDECMCDTSLCNREMGPIPTSTLPTTMTTTHQGPTPTALFVYIIISVPISVLLNRQPSNINGMVLIFNHFRQ